MIYFDNSATTRVLEPVIDEINNNMREHFANASSLHRFGYETEKKVIEARKYISKIINAKEEEIIFTSGGTESNNMAILGVCNAYKKYGNKVITTKIEHPSVLKCFKRLEEDGFEVCYLNVDERGYIDINNLVEEINYNTIFVSIMYVNNEIGTIQDIEKIGKLIKEKNKSTIFHTDAVQAFGKLKINVKNIDLLTVSGHKIHSQKGIGFLYAREGIRLSNIMFGASQQKGLRPGTINTDGIVGLYKASEIAYNNLSKNYQKVLEIKNEVSKIKDMLQGVYINGDEQNGIPYILSISFEDVKGEVLLHALEDRDIFVSTGSACSSRGKKELGAVDYVNKNMATSTIRVSFSAENSIEEAKEFNKVLSELVPMLRIYKRK